MHSSLCCLLSPQVCQFVVSVNGLNVLHVDYRTVSNLILTGPRTIVMEVMEEIEAWEGKKKNPITGHFCEKNSNSHGVAWHKAADCCCVQTDDFAFRGGGSLSFNNNSTGDYAKMWTIDTSIFSLWTSLCPAETQSGPLGGLSSHGCIGQNGFCVRGCACFLTVHCWIKALQEVKEPSTVGSGCHRWFPWDADIDKHGLVSSFVPRAHAVTLFLG